MSVRSDPSTVPERKEDRIHPRPQAMTWESNARLVVRPLSPSLAMWLVAAAGGLPLR
jgi:hypothetical protein